MAAAPYRVSPRREGGRMATEAASACRHDRQGPRAGAVRTRGWRARASPAVAGRSGGRRRVSGHEFRLRGCGWGTRVGELELAAAGGGGGPAERRGHLLAPGRRRRRAAAAHATHAPTRVHRQAPLGAHAERVQGGAPRARAGAGDGASQQRGPRRCAGGPGAAGPRWHPLGWPSPPHVVASSRRRAGEPARAVLHLGATSG